MGVIQPCCFEDKRNNRRNGLMRLTKSNRIIDNTSRVLKNHQKNKKKLSKQNSVTNNNNHSNLQLNEMISEDTVISNKESSEKKPRNRSKIEFDEKEGIYSFSKLNKKKKNKSISVDCSNPVIRKNSFDLKEEKSRSCKINTTFYKKNFMKGEFIGGGRFGEIYSGLNISNGEIVTIKIYNNISETQKNKIINNLELLYNLNHQNIIKAIPLNEGDLYDENGNLQIIYESINSNNVEEIIKKYGSLDEKVIQKYIKQLLEGLKYLHGNNIFHKNLKPSNILVDNDGIIKISDYLIDSLILGNAEEIYSSLLKSETINYYIPPFFIQAINKYKEEKSLSNTNKEKTIANNDKIIFDEWQSYDLWFLGCLIIEVYSKKKPWTHYNISNNSEFFKYLNSTHLIPTIPIKLSLQCQELMKILFDYTLTKQPNIYDIIFNLDFFKMDTNNFTYNNINNKITDLKSSLNDSQGYYMQNDEPDSSNLISESGMQLGKFLENNKVVNILNNNNSASFSVSYTTEDNNISFSQSFMNNKLNQSSTKNLTQSISSITKGKNLNNIDVNKYKNKMPEVEEAQVEQSPDPVKDEQEKNFTFSKQ